MDDLVSEHLTSTTHNCFLVTFYVRKWVGRETDTTRGIETEASSVTHTAQQIETGIVAASEKESTLRKRVASPASIETIEATRETEIKTSSVAETATKIEAGTVAATESGSKR